MTHRSAPSLARAAGAGVLVLLLGCGPDRQGVPDGPRTPTSASASSGAVAPASASANVPTPTPTPSGKKPNIIFILADDQRLDAAQCMPKVQELIATKGVTFTHNFASTPLCCPGRATILTGLYAHNHGVIMNGDIDDEDEDPDDKGLPGAEAFRQRGNDEKAFVRWLKAEGYATGYYGKYLNGYGKLLKQDRDYAPPYWDEWHPFKEPDFYYFQQVHKTGKGKSKLTCYLTSRTDVPKSKKHEKKCREGADDVVDDGKENYSTDVIADQAAEFIRAAARDGKPFFLHFAVKAPHGPFFSPTRYQPDLDKVDFTKEARDRLGSCPLYERKEPPASVLEEDVSDKPEWIDELGKLKPRKAEHLRKKQLMSVLATEDALARLVDLLKELQIEDDTILVYTGDNGFSWGEHNYLSKNCAYDECSKIPLMVFDPRRPAGGKTLDVFTMNIDLAPTFVELGGAKVAAGTKVDGQSMARLFAGDSSGWSRDHVLTECWGNAKKAHPDIHAAVRSKEWKYVEHYEDEARTKIKKRKGGEQELELYDLRKDPFEVDNLALLPAARLEALGTSPAKVKERQRGLAEILHQLEKD